MKKLILFLLIPLSMSCDRIIGEQGNGIVVTETFSPDNFTDLTISGQFNVVLVEGTAPRVTIKGDENLLEFIKVDSYGNELEIGSDRRLNSPDGIEVLIEYTRLEEIRSSGASNIKSEDQIRSEDLQLDVSGAGKIDLQVMTGRLEVELSGAALIYLSGQADDLEVNMSGAGSLEAFSLVTKNCELSISGVGNAEVNVSENLDVQVSGVGGVEYLGNPKNVVKDVSGMGKIKQAKD